MNPLFYLRSLQNAVNFAVRSRFSWARPLKSPDAVIKGNTLLQEELGDFLNLFDWDELIATSESTESLVLADVGARDFSFAPVFEKHFKTLGHSTQIHGIEIDAFRRYSNLRTRADYGRYYAAQVKRGTFHAMDFLNWHEDLNICFLLHPFVTPEPPLRWGLPLGAFRPEKLFAHAAHLLRKKRGILVLSNPTTKEYEISCNLAHKAGFEVSEMKMWQPGPQSIHQKPRYGAIFRCKPV